MLNNTKLSEIITTRLCHDLAGPIGAVSNGVDFLSDSDPTMREKANILIQNSAEQSIARLQFFRQLYGIVNNATEANLQLLRDIIHTFYNDSKIEIKWFESYDSLKGREGKLLLNLIYSCSCFLIRGGQINFNYQIIENQLVIGLSAYGDGIKVDPTNINIICGNYNEDEIVSKNINYYYLYTLINDVNGQIDWNLKDNHLSFTLKILRN